MNWYQPDYNNRRHFRKACAVKLRKSRKSLVSLAGDHRSCSREWDNSSDTVKMIRQAHYCFDIRIPRSLLRYSLYAERDYEESVHDL